VRKHAPPRIPGVERLFFLISRMIDRPETRDGNRDTNSATEWSFSEKKGLARVIWGESQRTMPTSQWLDDPRPADTLNEEGASMRSSGAAIFNPSLKEEMSIYDGLASIG